MKILLPQRLVTPTVKVRRLGYFCQLTKILRKYKTAPFALIIKDIEKWSVENKEFLKAYDEEIPSPRRRDSNGEIIPVGEIIPSVKHEDAKRYIRTANEIGLITNVGTRWFNTKRGNSLAETTYGENPFDITLHQKGLFLKYLLLEDYDYILTISKMKNYRGEEAQIEFRKNVKNRLKIKMESESNIVHLKKVHDDLDKWKKDPKKYFDESINATRIEWFWDLKALDWDDKNKKYKFKEDFNNSFLIQYPLTENLINNEYYANFYNFYKEFFKSNEIKYWENIPEKNKTRLLSSYLDECHRLFGSVGYWKISALQFFEYTCQALLFDKNIISGFEVLENSLLEKTKSGEIPHRYRKISGFYTYTHGRKPGKEISKEDIGYIVKEK